MRLASVLVLLVVFAGGGSPAAETPSADGVPISYETLGQGEPAVVLVHGWSCDRGYWRNQVADLAREHLVVAIDLAGHGASGQERADCTMAAFGADVAAVVKHLGLKKVILVGHSMGGLVILEAASQLAGQAQVMGLVGIDTLHEVGHGYPAEAVEGFLQPMKEDFPAFTGKFVGSMFPVTADSALVAQVAGDMGSAPPAVGVSAMRNLLTYDPHAVLAGLTAPIVCIDGPARPVNREAWAFYQPGYDVVMMEGVGHFPMLEKPAEFTAHLQEVLARF